MSKKMNRETRPSASKYKYNKFTKEQKKGKNSGDE